MKTEKSNKLRGTVLFTVIAVMALLIIFLTGTLALATASSNRAHKSYSSSQASYTAKTAIKGFTEAMSRDSNVSETVKNLGEGTNPSVIHPEVRINKSSGGAVDKSVGLIGYWDDKGVWQDNQIKVERVSSANEYKYDLDKKEWVAVDLVRIEATARVGKEESTVTAYLRKRLPQATPSHNTGSSGIKGFNTVGDGNFANGGRFTGGLGIGLKSNVKQSYILHNACEIDTTLTFINGNVLAGTATFAIDVHEQANRPVSETVINGNLYIANGQKDPLVQLDYQMHQNYTQRDIPYLYVDGVITTGSQCTFVKESDDAHKSPYNIFVGTLKADSEEYKFSSTDIYMMDKYLGDDNVYENVPVGTQWDGSKNDNVPVYKTVIKGDNYFGTGKGSNNLYEWVDSTLNRTGDQNLSFGGSIYCNGNLSLGMVNEIDGDVRVEGDCFIGMRRENGELKTLDGNCNVNIKGNLVVGGNLYIKDSYNVTANRIYCDPAKVHGYKGGTASPDETFTEVDNIYHIPDALKDVDLEAGVPKVEFPKRELFKWDPSVHRDAAGDMMLINGNKADDPYALYYRWKEDYAPYMRVYMDKDLGTFEYKYADESFDEDGYELLGTVDSYIDLLLKSESFLRDDVTTDIINKFIDVDSAKYESELPEENGQRKTWYRTTLEFIREDNGEPIFRNRSVETDKEFALYIAGNPDGQKLVTELPYYTRATIDGSDTGEVTKDYTTLYSNTTGRIVTSEYAAAAGSAGGATAVNGNVYPYASYGQPAYPVKMAREAIYTDDKTKNTKIIRTLTEVREEMSLDNLAEAYPNDVPTEDNHKANAEANIAWDESAGKKNTTITSDCTIRGTINGANITPNADGKKVITIDPKGKTIWVILENVQFQNDAEIWVDLTQGGTTLEAGKVCFLIKGTLELDKAAIVNKKMIPNGSTYYAFDHTEDWGMEFYGQQEDATKGITASRIIMRNGSTMTGTFRCPYTDFACTKNGKYKVLYTDEYGIEWGNKPKGQTRGQDYTDGQPPLIGNALFKDCIQKDQYGNKFDMNDFGMYYTACGQGGSSPSNPGSGPVTTPDGDVFDLLYFSGV